MQNLADYVKGDAFTQLNEDLINEYFMRNERKKQDEEWLKQHRPAILRGLEEMGKSRTDIGNIRVSVSVPDASHFDMDKVYEYADRLGILEKVTKRVIDEEKLMRCIENGEIALEDLKSYAWVEKKGTPRINVTKVRREHDSSAI